MNISGRLSSSSFSSISILGIISDVGNSVSNIALTFGGKSITRNRKKRIVSIEIRHLKAKLAPEGIILLAIKALDVAEFIDSVVCLVFFIRFLVAAFKTNLYTALEIFGKRNFWKKKFGNFWKKNFFSNFWEKKFFGN